VEYFLNYQAYKIIHFFTQPKLLPQVQFFDRHFDPKARWDGLKIGYVACRCKVARWHRPDNYKRSIQGR
jgi:hypothetical protein